MKVILELYTQEEPAGVREVTATISDEEFAVIFRTARYQDSRVVSITSYSDTEGKGPTTIRLE